MEDTEVVGLGTAPEEIQAPADTETDDSAVEPSDVVAEKQPEEKKATDGPPEGSFRFNQIYGKWKSTERELGETQRKLAEIEQRQIKHETSVATKEFNEKKTYFENRLDQAAQENDLQSYQAINRQFLEFISTEQKPQAQPTEQFSSAQTTQAQRDLAVFKDYYPWFEKDPDKTTYAFQVQKQIQATEEGKSLSNWDLLKEIGRRVETRYKATQNGFRDTSLSDGISPSAPSGTSIVGQLSEDEKKVALRTLTHLPKEQRLKAYAESKSKK